MLALILVAAVLSPYTVAADSSEEEDLICDDIAECADETYDISIKSKIECSATYACADTLIYADCLDDSCDIACTDNEACTNAAIIVDNVSGLQCDGFEACEYLYLEVSAVDGFELQCKGGNEVCSNSVRVIYAANDDTTIKGMSCVGDEACTCCGAQTYVGAGMEQIECDGPYACLNSLVQTARIVDGFEMTCTGPRSCGYGFYQLYTDPTNDMPTGLKFVCDGGEACAATYIDVPNYSDEELVIDELKCSGHHACYYLNFVNSGTGDVSIKKCICEDEFSCECAVGLEICDELEGEWDTTLCNNV